MPSLHHRESSTPRSRGLEEGRMTWLWVIGFGWLIAAVVVGLVMGRTVRAADAREVEPVTDVEASEMAGSPAGRTARISGRRLAPSYRQRAARACLPPVERRPVRTSEAPPSADPW